jgi:RNA polymerase sigma factor (sigma-70 family)
MTETSLVALRQLLLQGYDELKQRLTQRLGSPELAGEAIQDTWLRLQHTEAIGTVRSPANYLFRVALNLARDRLSADRRLLTAVEIETLLDIAAETPDPARTAEMRSELRAVEQLIAELPPRQREILVAARLDGMWRTGPSVCVTCISGTVRVEQLARAATIGPGQQARYDETGLGPRISKPRTSAATSRPWHLRSRRRWRATPTR